MKLNPQDLMKPTMREIRGMDVHRVIIIDNFLADPAEVRRLAMNLDMAEDNKSFYPGVSAVPNWDCSSLYYALQNILERTIKPSEISLRISAMTTKPKDLLPMQSRPHADHCYAAGMIYLNTPEQCSGGTAFYRHRATGFEWLPTTYLDHHRAAADRLGISIETLDERLKAEPTATGQYITGTNDEWELIDSIDMRNNRFVVYTGNLFHSAYYTENMFGDAIDQRRLTFNFFIW